MVNNWVWDVVDVNGAFSHGTFDDGEKIMQVPQG